MRDLSLLSHIIVLCFMMCESLMMAIYCQLIQCDVLLLFETQPKTFLRS